MKWDVIRSGVVHEMVLEDNRIPTVSLSLKEAMPPENLTEFQ